MYIFGIIPSRSDKNTNTNIYNRPKWHENYRNFSHKMCTKFECYAREMCDRVLFAFVFVCVCIFAVHHHEWFVHAGRAHVYVILNMHNTLESCQLRARCSRVWVGGFVFHLLYATVCVCVDNKLENGTAVVLGKSSSFVTIQTIHIYIWSYPQRTTIHKSNTFHTYVLGFCGGWVSKILQRCQSSAVAIIDVPRVILGTPFWRVESNEYVRITVNTLWSCVWIPCSLISDEFGLIIDCELLVSESSILLSDSDRNKSIRVCNWCRDEWEIAFENSEVWSPT